MAPPQDLIPDALSEILLRLPPSDPASLVRASAVCKPWLRTLTDPAFLRRYRAFHGGAPPLVLGFLRNPDDRDLPRFVPDSAAAFRQPAAAAAGHRTVHVLDCRHGRALLYDYGSCEFVAWDPITGRETRVRDEIPDVYTNHAVLCAAACAGCDHSGCAGAGPFLMVSAGVFRLNFVQVDAGVFSLETGAKIMPTDGLYLLDYDKYSLEDRAAAFVGGALYFVGSSNTLLRYDVLCPQRTKTLSLIKLPKRKHLGSVLAMEAEDGRLGLASLFRNSLNLWSRETGADGDAGWVQRRVIDLEKLLPVGSPQSSVCLCGFAESANVVFVRTHDGEVFSIDLKSLQVRRTCEMDGVDHIIPYVSFYTPAEAYCHHQWALSDLRRSIRGYNLANGM